MKILTSITILIIFVFVIGFIAFLPWGIEKIGILDIPKRAWIVQIALQVLLIGLFVMNGLKVISNNPPHRGLVTILGNRLGFSFREGFIFLPFHPWLFATIDIDITKKNVRLPVFIRTPDNVSLKISVAITISPDPENLINYLDSGERDGAFKILKGIIQQRLRQWARSNDGPKDWREAQSSIDTKIESLIKTIAASCGNINIVRLDNVKLKRLGIILNNLTLGEIKLPNSLSNYVQKSVKARIDEAAEIIGRDHFIKSIGTIAKDLKITTEEATEMFLVQTGKIKKSVTQKQIDLTPRTNEVLRDLAKIFFERGK